MRKHILLYGLLGGALIALLKVIEYRYLVIERSVEIYGGLIAIVFAVTGIWLGLKLTRKQIVIREIPVRVEGPFSRNDKELQRLGVTPRELEILELIAAGLSNREIAEKVFVSENTVKTHTARLLSKLGARRRTQAVQRGKEFGLIP